MKKTQTVEVEICDACQKEPASFGSCLGCGKHYCYNCREKLMVEYQHAPYFSGSGDGLYCFPCDARLTSDNDPLITAYQKIRSLCREERGFYEDFKKRSAKAEAAVQKLFCARKPSQPTE